MASFTKLPRLFLLLIIGSSVGKCFVPLDVHADPSELRELLEVQKELADKILKEHNGKCNRRVVELCAEFLDLWKSAANSSSYSPTSVLSGHPLNVLYLYDFWTNAAHEFRAMLQEANAASRLRLLPLLRRLDSSAPGERETRDVALSIIRLQGVYNLSTVDLIDGKVAGKSAVRPMSKSDCFLLADIARGSLLKGRYSEWHRRCTDKFVRFEAERAERESDRKRREEELEGRLRELNPREAEELHQRLPMDIVAGLEVGTKKDKEKKDGELDMFEAYRRLCRSEEDTTSLLPRMEKCVWYDMSCAFGRLAPHRLEFLSYDPVVALAHGAVGEAALERVQREVRSGEANLDAPKSVSSKSGEIKSNVGRTGLVGFLPKAPSFLNGAAARLTGLSMEHSEALQIVSYGVGGHYEPHIDYFQLSDNATSDAVEKAMRGDRGDRTATLLFYLGETEAGGATAFPRLGLAVRPRRGDALFWYNLHRSGRGDPYTLHAACPVLLGSKLIANQWFRELGQAAARPCALTEEL